MALVGYQRGWEDDTFFGQNHGTTTLLHSIPLSHPPTRLAAHARSFDLILNTIPSAHDERISDASQIQDLNVEVCHVLQTFVWEKPSFAVQIYKTASLFPGMVFDVSFLWHFALQSSFISDFSRVWEFTNSNFLFHHLKSCQCSLHTIYPSENTKVSTLPCWSPREITFCWASMLAPLVPLQWRPFLLEPPRWEGLGRMELSRFFFERKAIPQDSLYFYLDFAQVICEGRLIACFFTHLNHIQLMLTLSGTRPTEFKLRSHLIVISWGSKSLGLLILLILLFRARLNKVWSCYQKLIVWSDFSKFRCKLLLRCLYSSVLVWRTDMFLHICFPCEALKSWQSTFRAGLGPGHFLRHRRYPKHAGGHWSVSWPMTERWLWFPYLQA